MLFYDCLSGTQECGCLWDVIIIWKSDSDLCEQNFLRIISFLNFQIQQRGEQQSAQTINNCNTSDPSSAQGDLLKGIVICLGVARSVVQSPVRASHSNFCNTFWPRFHIVVLGMTFFFQPIYFSIFYLDFYFPFLFGLLSPFFIWTFISRHF